VANYSPKDWDVKLSKYPTVLNYPEHGLANRDVMLGIAVFGAARAFPYELVVREKLVRDRIGSEPVILLLGPDGQSVRAFRISDNGASLEFFRTPDGSMMDSATGSRWDFRGCATNGKLKGACLERITVLKDYWFDWRNYHPATSVYSGSGRRKPQKKAGEQ
jgi:hypothetical protein